MITTIDGDARHFNEFGWLKTFWLFSFADYYTPDNIQFGLLRVFNDDVVVPGTGFPTHPHEEMEIITAEKKSDFILIDLPTCRGWGYDEKTLRGSRF